MRKAQDEYGNGLLAGDRCHRGRRRAGKQLCGGQKGLPIPPGLLEVRKLYDWRGFMVAGVISMAAGIALLIFFCALITWQVDDVDQRFLPFISAFPLCVSVACLLIAKYLKQNE